MPTDNVTAIQAGKPRRSKRVLKVGLGGLPEVGLGGLTDPDTFKGFTTHDLISGLHGVCVVIDSVLVDRAEFEDHINTMAGLAQAAKVLSSILNTEAHS